MAAMSKSLTTAEVRELIRRQVGDNQSAWAGRFGIAPSYVSDVLSGRREPGQRILDALGLERVLTYRRAEREQAA
jgi:DNA-binding transcriptional regulator YdaS (Cro superfamily)